MGAKALAAVKLKVGVLLVVTPPGKGVMVVVSGMACALLPDNTVTVELTKLPT